MTRHSVHRTISKYRRSGYLKIRYSLRTYVPKQNKNGQWVWSLESESAQYGIRDFRKKFGQHPNTYYQHGYHNTPLTVTELHDFLKEQQCHS